MLLSSKRAYKVFEEAEEEIQFVEKHKFNPLVMEDLRENKLANLWERAQTAEYYNQLANMDSRRDFHTLPITPKNAVKDNIDAFTSAYGSSFLKYYETSGTTGKPTVTLRCPEDIIWNILSVASLWKNVLTSDDRVVTLLPSDVAPTGDLISYICEYLQIPFARCYPFAVGICDWDRLEHIFQHYHPTCIFAAPGVLIQWMRILKQRGHFGETQQSVNKILLLGEVCTSSLQDMLARNWQAKVYDASYGSTETGTLAVTCPQRRLHALMHSFLLELQQRDDQIVPFAPGQEGELIITPLNNYARPLLRYASGDFVKVESSDICSCGLQLPVINVLGRRTDIIDVHGKTTDVETIERVIYSTEGITGYVIEMNQEKQTVRLLLEKDIDIQGETNGYIQKMIKVFHACGLYWDDVVLLNQLPAITKSGAGQKNWKKTNVRIVS